MGAVLAWCGRDRNAGGKGVSFKAEHFPRNEDKLTLFLMHVDAKRTAPDWLLEFMAEGAREFLIGGKAWQKGKGGGPKSGYGQKEIEAYILHHYGGLTASQIVQLGEFPDDGKDRTRTVERQIKRGEVAFVQCLRTEKLIRDLDARATLGLSEVIDWRKAIFNRLAALPFDLLSVENRDACRAKLLAARDRLARDEQEAGYD